MGCGTLATPPLATPGPVTVLLLLLTGCMTTWTHQGVEPGALVLPPVVETLAVIDRTGDPQGQPVVVGFSGAALARGTIALAPAPAVASALAGDAAAILTAPVGPASALAACARTGSQALVTAHSVWPDPFWNFERKDDGTWMAHHNARLRVGFRVWDCAGRRLHDVEMHGWQTVSAEGADRPGARSAVPPERIESAGRAAAAEAGRALADALVPVLVQRSRPLFSRGPLRPGVRALMTGDLAAAHGVFRAASTTLDSRRRARALHDLAVVAEAAGDLEAALDHVTDALVLDPHPATVALRTSLMRRAVIEQEALR